MLYEIVPHSRGGYNRVREDQIRYSIEKSLKKKPRVRIKFGAEVAEKAKIFIGEKLKIQWDDVNKQLLIIKSDDGFKVQHPPRQKCFIIFDFPEKVKLPNIDKTFTNFYVSRDQIILDFSLVKED